MYPDIIGVWDIQILYFSIVNEQFFYQCALVNAGKYDCPSAGDNQCATKTSHVGQLSWPSPSWARWTQGDLNSWPSHCKCDALPAKLWALRQAQGKPVLWTLPLLEPNSSQWAGDPRKIDCQTQEKKQSLVSICTQLLRVFKKLSWN